MSKTIAIIGGGVSGSLVALNIIKLCKTETCVLWFDNNNSFCKGLAYSTQEDVHLLNVRASNMSVFDDEPSHFVNWLHKYKLPFSDQDFVPRSIYGEYVFSTYNDLICSNPKVKITFINEEVQSITKEDNGYCVLSNQVNYVEQIVLAFGNFLPSHPKSKSLDFRLSDNYFQNAFSEQIILSALKKDCITIIGSGLTMVDVVLTLTKHNYQGNIIVISPHGYLPQAHSESSLQSIPVFINEKEYYSLLQLFSLVNKQLKFAKINSLNAHSVIDALRPRLQQLWLAFSLEDKKQFLRHLRHKWGVARHRCSPISMNVINDLIKMNRLSVIKGRIFDIKSMESELEIHFLDQNQAKMSLNTSILINCTGPESNFEKIESVLITQLLKDGIIEVDDLKYGIKADSDGKIRDNVFTLGPPLKGILWESTAVPEIRVQAKSLARIIVGI